MRILGLLLLDMMMKVTGFLLLVGGWTIVVAALLLLPGTAARIGFALAGLGVQILGLVLAVWAHRVVEVDRG